MKQHDFKPAIDKIQTAIRDFRRRIKQVEQLESQRAVPRTGDLSALKSQAESQPK